LNFNGLHGVIFQKIELFITVSVGTLNLKFFSICYTTILLASVIGQLMNMNEVVGGIRTGRGTEVLG
jgi:hypothetical protein